MVILFLVVVIVACFTLIGFRLALYYINRKKFFSALNVFLTSFKLDINFAKQKMDLIVENNAEQIASDDLKVLLANFRDFLNKKEKPTMHIFDGISILKKEEKVLILKMFQGFGRYDAQSQVVEIENYKNQMDNFFGKADEDCKKYASMFIKMGFIIGLLICLIVI